MHAGFPYDRDDPATWAPSGALLAHALAAAGHAEETAQDLEDARWLLNQTARFSRNPRRVRAGQGRLRARAGTCRGRSRPGRPGSGDLRQQPGPRAAGPGRSGGRQGGLRAGAADRRGELRARPPQRRHRRQQPGRVLQDLGDLAGARAAFERALRSTRRASAPTTPTSPSASTTWARCCRTWAIWRAPGRPSSGRSRSTRRASAPTTPTSPSASTTWAGCCETWAIWRAPGRPSSGRCAIDEASFGPDHPNVAIDVNNLGLVLQSPGRSGGRQGGLRAGARIDERASAPTTPRSPSTSTTWAWCCGPWAIWRAPGRPTSGRCASLRSSFRPITRRRHGAQEPAHVVDRSSPRCAGESLRRVAAALCAGAVSRALPWFTCRRCSAAIDPIAPRRTGSGSRLALPGLPLRGRASGARISPMRRWTRRTIG